jgi:hypothetical protein
VYNFIVQAGVSGEYIHNAKKIKTFTTKHTIKATVKAAIATRDTL